MPNNPLQGFANRVGSEVESFAGNVVKRTKQAAFDAVSDTGFGKALRSFGLLSGANPLQGKFSAGSWDTGANTDWRVKLSLPPSPEYTDSVLLDPLKETGGFVFPYTPTVYISQSANYSAVSPVHSNYPFQVYQNSSVAEIQIQGDFTVENSREAEYWIGAVHYLKSVSKMSYGQSSTKGSPPPVVKLNGYGDYVFNNVPVVITQFTVSLDPDVDYISAPLSPNGSWAPAQSNISVVLAPAYSRDKVNRFNLNDFVSGSYVLEGSDGPGYQ